jgi:hypothetical protein
MPLLKLAVEGETHVIVTRPSKPRRPTSTAPIRNRI